MSEFLYLIEAAINPHHNDGLKAHAIGLCSDPQSALAGIHSHWPFTDLRLIHSIRSENRSQMLYDVLRNKFREHHFKFNWYRLSPDAIAWFSSITDESYTELIRVLENEDAQAHGVEVRDVTGSNKRGPSRRPKPEKPGMTAEEVEELRQQLLSQIEDM